MSAADVSLAPVEAPEIDLTVQEPDSPQETVESVEKPQPDEKMDGRRMDDDLRKHIKSLRDQANQPGLDPKEAQSLKNRAANLQQRLGQWGGYTQAFPKVEEARQAAALIKGVGGAEGIARMQETEEKVRRMDEMVANGDPKVVDGILENAGANAGKLTTAMLDKLASSNPQAYQTALAPHTAAYLKNEGLFGTINAIAEAWNSGNTQQVKSLFERVLAWSEQRQQEANPKVAAADPEREKFEAERSKFEQEKINAEIQKISGAEMSYASEKIDENVKPYLKRLKLDDEGMQDLRQSIWNEITKDRKTNTVHQAALRANYNGKMPKPELLNVLKQHTDNTVKTATQNVLKRRYGWVLNAPVAAPKPNPTAQPLRATAAAPKNETFEQTLARRLNEQRQAKAARA